MVRPQKVRVFFFATAVALAASARCHEPLRVVLADDHASVLVGNELFATYHARSGTKPVVFPLVGPQGERMTRTYPIGPLGPSESADHVHHRSVWIGYEGVNGIDFWHEPEVGVERPLPTGSVRHREFVRADSTGSVATLGARNDWTGPDGSVVCQDQRLMEFRVGDRWRAIDWTLDLWSPEGPLRLGDTKEGFFAVRVPGAMKVDAGLGGVIRNSRGETDAAAWGRPAEWADYSGPTQPDRRRRGGVAIFSHPGNDNPAPRWHTRTYGLHAVNPFGVGPYLAPGEKGVGGLTVRAGERIRLRYCIWLHDGEADDGDLRDAFAAYVHRTSRGGG